MTPTFTSHTLHHIRKWLSEAVVGLEAGEKLSFMVPNPDDHAGQYTGTKADDGTIYHSYQALIDLASLNGLRFCTPKALEDGVVEIQLQRLQSESSPHGYKAEDPTEKYGSASPFWNINKLEEPHFLETYAQALREVKLQAGSRILDLGVHKGDEFSAFPLVYDTDLIDSMHFTGVDHCESALAYARQAFPGENYDFRNLDINRIDESDLPPQDLIISVGTFQSPGVDDKDLIIRLRKKLLKPKGAFILGFPCVRYTDGEHRFGAQVKNYSESELGLLTKDLFYFRRYLQGRGFNVTLRGKYYIFLTALPR